MMLANTFKVSNIYLQRTNTHTIHRKEKTTTLLHQMEFQANALVPPETPQNLIAGSVHGQG